MLNYPFQRTTAGEQPAYYRLGAQRSVIAVTLPSGQQASLVARHRDVKNCLRDTRLSRAAMGALNGPRLTVTGPDPAFGLLGLDPPRHTAIRRIVQPAFTVQEASRVAEQLRQNANALLTQMTSDADQADLHESFSIPFNSMVICEMFSLPKQDAQQLHRHVRNTQSLDAVDAPHREASYNTLRSIFTELTASASQHDDNGPLRALDDAAANGHISRSEQLQLSMNLFIGGLSSGAHFFTSTVLHLLQRPANWAALVDGSISISHAVEEALRYDVAGDSGLPRLATADIPLQDSTIMAGTIVIPGIALANRDPRVFAKADQFDINRHPNPHLGFGAGPHYCIGAHLARTQLNVGLAVLTRRLPRLALATSPHDLRWVNNNVTGGVQTLPVTW